MEDRESVIPQPEPEFQGGSFNIPFFAPEQGFTIKQGRSLRRRDELTIPFPARGINQGNKAEVEFQEKQNTAATQRGEQRDVRPLQSPDFKIKIGILNLRRDGDALIFDTKPSTFVEYNDDKNVGTANPNAEELRRNLGEAFSVAVILTTTEPDGTSKMIVQHRSAENRSYKDMIGASAAGYADHELDPENKGALKTVDDDYIYKMACKETEEEVGIDADYLSDVKITGIVEDTKRVHYEAVLLGTVNLSAKEIEQKAIEKKSVKRGAFDFSEDFFVIDATPEAIETLLTTVKNPIPPTHIGAFVATGRMMVLKRDGEEEAKNWTKRMEKLVKENVEDIDRLIREGTNGLEQGYNPRKTPQEQGLPSIQSELERTGLMKKEKTTTIDEAYIFDVDGVLTTPDTREIDREIMLNIIERLNKGEPVILNTGRSLSWVESRLIARLYHSPNLKDVNFLQNLLVIGEKGGTWLEIDEKGIFHEFADDSVSVNEDLQRSVRAIVEERFPKTMFYDKTKKTMISVEMNEVDDTRLEGKLTLDEFKKEQQILVQELERLIKTGVYEDLKIDVSTIATDIQNKKAGKDYAIKKALAWLSSKKIAAKKFVTVGDSLSDAAMATELSNNGQNVEFVFVGNEKDRETIKAQNHPFTVHFPQGQFNKGTAEFLRSE
jgi:8-oxo-dGTP pyrophosphatase MutT (NUDIX family)